MTVLLVVLLGGLWFGGGYLVGYTRCYSQVEAIALASLRESESPPTSADYFKFHYDLLDGVMPWPTYKKGLIKDGTE